jgi:hypothetical protein
MLPNRFRRNLGRNLVISETRQRAERQGMEGLHWVSFRFRVQGLRLPLASMKLVDVSTIVGHLMDDIVCFVGYTISPL